MSSSVRFTFLALMSGVLLAGVFTVAGHGQAQTQPVVYVSAEIGVDSNSCTRSSPCRQISKALTLVSPGGTILVLGSGEYGPIDIRRSVSIIGEIPGATTIKASSDWGASAVVARMASSSSDKPTVVLKGLKMRAENFDGTALTAYLVNSILVENCILWGSKSVVVTEGTYTVKDSRLVATFNGVVDEGSAGKTTAIFDNCSFEGGDGGSGGLEVGMNGNPSVSVTRSTFHNSTLIQSGGKLHVEDTFIGHSAGDGVTLYGGQKFSISNSALISNGGYGINNSGRVPAVSFGNNRFFGNTSGSTAGSLTTFALK